MAVAPIVMPLNVTMAGKLPPIEPDCSVSTMLDAPLAPQLAVAPPLKVTLLGVTLEAKKPGGYVSVIVSDAASAPPAVGVKPNVTGLPARFTTRSVLAMPNPTAVTAFPMYPDGVPTDVNGS